MLKTTDKARNLGVIMDPDLNFSSHTRPQFPLDTCVLRYGSDPVLLCCLAIPTSCVLILLWYDRQLAAQGRGVPEIITGSLATAVIGICHKKKTSGLNRRISRGACVCLFEICVLMSTWSVLFFRSNRMLYCHFDAWLPVCSVLNSAKLLCRAPASTRNRSPVYLCRGAPDCRSWDGADMQRTGPGGN